MHPATLIVQRPQTASELILLSHGVGSEPRSMLGVAHWFASRKPTALIVSVASTLPHEISAGYQWFSVHGVTEANRPARVAAAMPDFVASVSHWQLEAGVGAAQTTLVGFSQGAIMALESSQLPAPPAHTVLSLSGRYATLPSQRPACSIHLLHGTADPVIPVEQAQAAHARLKALGASCSLHTLPGLGHMPHPALLELWAGHQAPAAEEAPNRA